MALIAHGPKSRLTMTVMNRPEAKTTERSLKDPFHQNAAVQIPKTGYTYSCKVKVRMQKVFESFDKDLKTLWNFALVQDKDDTF